MANPAGVTFLVVYYVNCGLEMRNVWGTDRRDFLADSSGLWQNQMFWVDVVAH